MSLQQPNDHQQPQYAQVSADASMLQHPQQPPPPQQHVPNTLTNVAAPTAASYPAFDLAKFWTEQMHLANTFQSDFKSHPLPLARIKKVMKTDQEVKMISAEAPILFAKGCEIFITELTKRAWVHAEENKRRTLQRSDVATAISKTDMCDFLIDIVPREEAMKSQSTHYEHQQQPEYANYYAQAAVPQYPAQQVDPATAATYQYAQFTPEQMQYQLHFQLQQQQQQQQQPPQQAAYPTESTSAPSQSTDGNKNASLHVKNEPQN